MTTTDPVHLDLAPLQGWEFEDDGTVLCPKCARREERKA